jgi:hypothetical protein
MDINIEFGLPVVELDQLIRRALQDHYLEVQPPMAAWESIMRHLARGKQRVPAHRKCGFPSETTSGTTRHPNHG